MRIKRKGKANHIARHYTHAALHMCAYIQYTYTHMYVYYTDMGISFLKQQMRSFHDAYEITVPGDSRSCQLLLSLMRRKKKKTKKRI